MAVCNSRPVLLYQQTVFVYNKAWEYICRFYILHTDPDNVDNKMFQWSNFNFTI